MYLYLYQNEAQNTVKQRGEEKKDSSGFSEQMVRKALRDYNNREKLGIPVEKLDETEIQRREKGKPYFSLPEEKDRSIKPQVHYSVSHSRDWWGCLMAEEPVGFDLEIFREKIDFEKIAKRFFTEEEHKYTQLYGLEGFFELWVRKEAYIKYLGLGLAKGLNTFSVIQAGKLSSRVIEKKKGRGEEHLVCHISACEIQKDVKAAYCSGSGKSIKSIISLK